jgi:hypothetical protein
MRHAAQLSPANDLPDELPSATGRRARRRAEWASSLLFAGSSLLLFVILLGCVFAATVLYYRWH